MVCMEMGLKILVSSAEVTLKPLCKKKTEIWATTIQSEEEKEKN